ncbi:MAG: PAS domain S-box protein [Deltaproteobacteria bacterium]|nr:PAS domain S-box protein [Deltaproteobacteria bacterium]MBI3388937.1 PAS domain S-box protein [Deltaproteobacteria bacterium]
MAERARIVFGIILVSNLVFAFANAAFREPDIPALYLLKAGQIAVVTGAWLALRRRVAAGHAVTVLVLSLSAIAVLTAASGAMSHDVAIYRLLSIGAMMTTAAVLPWGWRAQLELVFVAALAALGNLWLVNGTVASLVDYSGIAMIVTFGASVYVSFAFEQQRMALARNEAARAGNQRLFRSLIEHVTDVIATLGIDGTIRYVSPSIEPMLGYRPDALVGRSALDFIPADEVARARTALAAVLAQPRVPRQIELRMQHADGSRRALEGMAQLLVDVPDGPWVVANLRDLTARKRAEQKTVVLLDVAKTVAATLDRRELLDRVHTLTSAALSCDAAATFYLDTQRNVFRMIAQRGILPEHLPLAEEMEFPPGVPFGGRVTRGETLVLNGDLPDDLRVRFPRISALIAAPLMVRGRHLGVFLAIDRTIGRRFDAEDADLCGGIAQQLAVAMEGADLFAAQREEAEVAGALAGIGQELIAALDTPVLLDRLCRLTAEALGCDCCYVNLKHPDQPLFIPTAHYGDAPEQWETLRLVRLPEVAIAAIHAQLRSDGMIEFASNDAGPDHLAAQLPAQAGLTQNLLQALRRGDETIGFLHAAYRGRTEPFTARQHRIARGIAHIASLALENARLVEELDRANRFKSDFLASMSHELRSPLNVIIGYGTLLIEQAFGPLSGEQVETIQRLDKSARELLDLVSATLDLSRFDAQNVPLALGTVDIAALADELARESQVPPDKPSLRLQWDVASGLPVLYTDALKLKMVLKNLIGNALKFTEQGTVWVRAGALADGVAFEVSDTGIGIPPAAREHIFEPFRQADGATNGRYGGAGLGLYIVRRLLTALGGTIEVESEVGRGSTFRVSLPATARDAADDRGPI